MNANSDREYIDNKVGDVRTAVDDVRMTVNDLRTTVDDLRTTMNERFTAIDAKIDSVAPKVSSEIIKWGVGLFVATIALNVALLSVVLHVALREPPPSPPPPPPAAAPVQPISTPSVIIQLTPQGATVVPAAPPAGKP